MMAMVRLNVPSVFMYGGSILPGRFKGKDVTIRVEHRPHIVRADARHRDRHVLALEAAGRIDPPYMKTDGTLSRTIAIISPGSDLSQPARPTSAS